MDRPRPRPCPGLPARAALIAVLLAAAVLAACGGREPAMTETPSDPTPPANPIERAAALARADLARRLGVAEARVEVLERRAVTWPNGAMGCPEPGMMYTQALVPGVWIRLSVDGEDHLYHGRRDGEPFLCPAERAAPPPEIDPLS
ncbi:hypothetical protein HFP89_07250 [Wenzhouxiangella sp. XN79A]|uniref:hypothetical protein n=1 Tax=Wenzhouxiangella sp. XN79A TaxID=2724193 RepID=UPI00144A7404|nr:hypothetical protein [Wenzhouxiangella sp. XN79A]NKI34958.1 hypothetical protein [Wenzhouxiangella sp. XN79A]